MANVSSPQQLYLNVSLRTEATFDNFFVSPLGKNQQVLAALQNNLGRNEGGFLFLWGESGSGVSHLLQGACHAMTSAKQTSAFLPLQELQGYAPEELLANLEQQALVCIDNLHYVAGKRHWETALFHLFNRMREQQSILIIGANANPYQLAIQLPDLQSRLQSGITFQVQALNDEEKITALRQNARSRGMDLSEEVAQFILHRAPRDTNELFSLLDILDERSLSDKRRLTIPFVKEVMSW